MKESYSPIKFGDMHNYLDLLRQANCKASDYSFANLFGWAPHYGLEFRFDGVLCWIRQTWPQPCYWAPIGPWAAIEDWAAKPEMSCGARFTRIPEELRLMWEGAMPGKLQWQEARGQWDYLYLSKELATLSGNRFHKKKNLWKQFSKNYEYTYQSLTDNGVEAVIDLQHEWCKWRDCESSEILLAENDAVARVLVHFSEIPGLCGGTISINNELVAYTIGEPVTEDSLVVHFEKACSTVKGGYQAINYLFCNDAGRGYTYINREQDIDDEGLRQAKLSYNPVDFIKKFDAAVL